MSQTIKFTVSDENYNALRERAGSQTLQDYIRTVLFPEQASPITPEMAVSKALAKYTKGERFTVTEIFGDDWNLANGYAGVFGRNFFKLVKSDFSDKIRFTETFNRKGHTVYEII